MKRILVGVGSVAVTLGLAACGTATDTPTTPTPTITPVPAVTSAAPARAADACPVTTEILVAALAASPDVVSRVFNPGSLVDAVCYDGFAVAHTIGDDTHDNVSVLFQFREVDQKWVAVNLGSANFCEGYTSAEVADHLPGCGG